MNTRPRRARRLSEWLSRVITLGLLVGLGLLFASYVYMTRNIDSSSSRMDSKQSTITLGNRIEAEPGPTNFVPCRISPGNFPTSSVSNDGFGGEHLGPEEGMSATTSPTTTNPADSISLASTASVTVTISGLVFNDINCNQRHDLGEPGMAGVELRVDKLEGPRWNATTITGPDGRFTFDNVLHGCDDCDWDDYAYHVGIVAPAGYYSTYLWNFPFLRLHPGKQLFLPFGFHAQEIQLPLLGR